MTAQLAEVVGSAVLGCVFASAGISKLLRPNAVRATVEGYRLLAPAPSRVVARLLGPVEVATGMLLAASPVLPFAQGVRIAAGLELVGFSGVIASALARGIRIPCGCGPIVGDHVVTRTSLVRNGVLILLVMSTVVARGAAA